MKIEAIEALWASDCKIDRTNLDGESLRIPELHNKYYKIYLGERVILKKKELEQSEFVKIKTEYYLGQLDTVTLQAYGWEQFQLRVLKADIGMYLDADKQIQDKKLEVFAQREKVEFVQSILETLNQRGWQIKNAIDFIKFSNGGH